MITKIEYGGEGTSEGKKILIPPSIALRNLGPVLDVFIMQPSSTIKKGDQVAAIKIPALIDTGAISSVITPEIADKLNLVHTGFTTVTSVQDQQKRPVFFGRIQFHWGKAIDIPLVACPIKGTAQCLIGREILNFWYLTYNGRDGTIVICD
ncbi:hypothetical protein JXQ70_19890 [bacterium]|nr:hypothetical protein [bacterium]